MSYGGNYAVMRQCGILLHITSLPSDYGIGSFGLSAYKFIDFLHEARQTLWQVLPLSPTSYGNSPYQSCSTVAGNEYFIDLDMLKADGLLTDEDLAPYKVKHDRIDYGYIYNTRFTVLNIAFENFKKNKAYNEFIADGKFYNYAVFRALKDKFDKPWYEWPIEYSSPSSKAVVEFAEKNKRKIEFQLFLQYEFAKQWKALKSYANSRGVKIIGDMPIYTAYDSVEMWENPELFLVKNGKPTLVAGVPPDYFSKTGQLWGNPLYNWAYHKKTNFDWWIKRLAHNAELFDTVRIDHFRGFSAFWAVPYGDETAVNGKWLNAPGTELFDTVKERIPDLSIIVEDLGTLDNRARHLITHVGYPNMKIAQFGLTGDQNNEHYPLNYQKNCVAYTGTHDNNTTVGFLRTLRKNNRNNLINNINRLIDVYKLEKLPDAPTSKDFANSIVAALLMSNADTVIIPLQDYMLLDASARINTPSTLSALNWSFVIDERVFDDFDLSDKIGVITIRSDRNIQPS